MASSAVQSLRDLISVITSAQLVHKDLKTIKREVQRNEILKTKIEKRKVMNDVKAQCEIFFSERAFTSQDQVL